MKKVNNNNNNNNNKRKEGNTMKKVNKETLRKAFEKGYSYAIGMIIEGGCNNNATTTETYVLKAFNKVDFITPEGVKCECKFNEGNRFTKEGIKEKGIQYFLLSYADNKKLKPLFEKGYKGLFSAYVNRIKVYIVPVNDLLQSGLLLKAGIEKGTNRQYYRIGYKKASNDNTPKKAYIDFLEGYETL